VVDGPYYQAGQTIDGKPVKQLSGSDASSVNLVIGFNDYKKARASLGAAGQAAIFIDAPHRLDFFDYGYIKEHEQEFSQTYESLADDRSREVFIAFINAKISGDPSPLYELAEFNQYFNDLIDLTDNEVFVDAGAYDGDTVLKFAKTTRGHYKHIYAFEPVPKNQAEFSDNIKQAGLKNITLIKKGCWSEPTKLKFLAEANMSTVGVGTDELEVDSIDNVLNGQAASFIKMDIEGAELPALHGAAKTISQHHPKLAICVYHKPEDLIEIPKYIKSLYPDYKFYLRHHQYISWETVLYATTEEAQ